MYGMVNRAIRDLIMEGFGEAKWLEVCDEADLGFDDFNDTVTYDDAVTFQMVDAAATVLELTSHEVLVMFGRHWIRYTGKDGWGHLLQMAGHDVRSMLAGLDALHSRVEIAMREARMPSFESVENSDGSIEVRYWSERRGLESMVIGLLEGIAERFNEDWSVSYDGRRTGDEPAVFTLKPIHTGSEVGGKTVGVA